MGLYDEVVNVGKWREAKTNEKAKPCPKCGGDMPIPGKLTKNQKEALKNWNAVVGYPFMHLDEVQSGAMSFREAWYSNLNWLHNVYSDAQNFYHGEPNECDGDCGHEEKVK